MSRWQGPFYLDPVENVLLNIATNNSIKFFIVYVPSQQLQGQLQTQHSVYTGNYIKDKQNM
jgi:hypothetical protein